MSQGGEHQPGPGPAEDKSRVPIHPHPQEGSEQVTIRKCELAVASTERKQMQTPAKDREKSRKAWTTVTHREGQGPFHGRLEPDRERNCFTPAKAGATITRTVGATARPQVSGTNRDAPAWTHRRHGAGLFSKETTES